MASNRFGWKRKPEGLAVPNEPEQYVDRHGRVRTKSTACIMKQKTMRASPAYDWNESDVIREERARRAMESRKRARALQAELTEMYRSILGGYRTIDPDVGFSPEEMDEVLKKTRHIKTEGSGPMGPLDFRSESTKAQERRSRGTAKSRTGHHRNAAKKGVNTHGV